MENPKMKTLMISLLVLFTAAQAFAEEIAPAEAFAKTFVAGEKKFNLKNVVVTYAQSVKSAEKDKWKEKCTVSVPASLNGNFPRVALSIPSVDCGEKHQPRELSLLGLFSSKLIY